MSKFVQSLQTLISEHQIETALNLLSDFFKEKDADLFKECLMHRGSLADLKYEQRTRTQSADELELSENRLMEAVTELTFKVEEIKFDDDLYYARAVAATRNKKALSDLVEKLMSDKNPRNLWLAGGLSLVIAVGIYFFYNKKASESNPQTPVQVLAQTVQTPQQPSKSLVDRYKIAETLRSNDKLDEAIKECTIILESEPCYWEASNLKAECQMLKALSKSDNLPDLEKAVLTARQALECNPADIDGYIYSTLAQIYGEMHNDVYFYRYLDSTLTRDIPVWKYLDQPGFKKYRNQKPFKAAINLAKSHQ